MTNQSDLLKVLRGQRIDGRTVEEVMALAADEIGRLQVSNDKMASLLREAAEDIHPKLIKRITELEAQIERLRAELAAADAECGKITYPPSEPGDGDSPVEGYSQAYADQMRTALLHIGKPVYLNMSPVYADPDNVKAICDGLNERIKMAQDALLPPSKVERLASDGSMHASDCGVFACDPCDCKHAEKSEVQLCSICGKGPHEFESWQDQPPHTYSPI